MLGLLPLLFAVTIAETSTAARIAFPFQPLHGWGAHLCALAVSLALWLLLSETMARLVSHSGQRRWLMRWDFTAQALILAWYAWACFGWGWSRQTSLFTSALAPWVVMQMAHWWCLALAARRISGHPWSRAGLVAHHVRFGILPMLIVLPFFDAGAWLAARWNIEEEWFAGKWGALRATYCAQLFMIVAMAGLPALLVPLWGARRLPASELQELMLAACARMRVRVAGLMRWPIPGGRAYNAAVIGLAPRLRYVLFTDDLMRDLPPPQVLAVLGHELGHVRHRHLWIYFLFANLTILVSALFSEPVAGALRPALHAGAHAARLTLAGDQLDALAQIAALLLVLAALWRLAFGVLSRACERQADLAGADLAGDPQVMCDALKSVARLSGQREDEPSWRHYSIAQRVDFLAGAQRDPTLASRHHRRVRIMCYGLVLLILGLLLLAGFAFDGSALSAPADDPILRAPTGTTQSAPCAKA
jgi:Zn-dependent protease with chaperone function